MIFEGRNRVTSGYRLPDRKGHDGIDVVGDDDTTVHATVAGKIGFAGIMAKKPGDLTWQWGYYVRIDDDTGKKHYFCHMAAGSLRVKAGQRVAKGAALGTMGNTGYSFGPHTHYEVRTAAGVAIDPTPYAGVKNAKGTCIESEEENDMKFLQVTSGRCEVFSSANVNAIDTTYNGGKLREGMCYPVQALVGSGGGFEWVRIQAGDKQRYAVLLADRCKLVELSAGDAIQACMAQATVATADTEQLDNLTAERDAYKQQAARVPELEQVVTSQAAMIQTARAALGA